MCERLLTELSFQSYLRAMGQPSMLGQTAAEARNSGFSQAQGTDAIQFGLKAAQSSQKEYTSRNV